MPEEIANNLFIPFKTKKEGGTGLGLTIAKKIIDLHSGRIQCNTSSNGTEFKIIL
jgi:two-component system nitrogen regulation sensor histidine kinase GlnL